MFKMKDKELRKKLQEYGAKDLELRKSLADAGLIKNYEYVSPLCWLSLSDIEILSKKINDLAKVLGYEPSFPEEEKNYWQKRPLTASEACSEQKAKRK